LSIMPFTSSSSAGQDLRNAREQLGISRARLAGLADCSLSSLAWIEQGACPRRSRVLVQAWAALAAVAANRTENDHAPIASGRVGKEGTTDAHPEP